MFTLSVIHIEPYYSALLLCFWSTAVTTAPLRPRSLALLLRLFSFTLSPLILLHLVTPVNLLALLICCLSTRPSALPTQPEAQPPSPHSALCSRHPVSFHFTHFAAVAPPGQTLLSQASPPPSPPPPSPPSPPPTYAPPPPPITRLTPPPSSLSPHLLHILVHLTWTMYEIDR